MPSTAAGLSASLAAMPMVPAVPLGLAIAPNVLSEVMGFVYLYTKSSFKISYCTLSILSHDTFSFTICSFISSLISL